MNKYLVWDIPTRMFHWLLVIAVVMQWVTAEFTDDMELHSYVGYGLLGLLLFRVMWGFVGTRHARFLSFVKGPQSAIAYAKDKDAVTAGHNPFGGWMVIVMLVTLIMQGVSGLFITDDVLFNGPYYSSVSDELQSTMGWIHHNGFTVIQILVALHILAVLWYQFGKKQALVNAMFSGKKAVSEDQAISSSRLPLALIVIVITALAIGALVYFAPVVEDDFYF